MKTIKVYTLILTFLTLTISCKKEVSLSKIEGSRLEVNDNLETDQSIENFIRPYREHVKKNLDSVLSFAVSTYTKRDGELNTAIGNLMADAVFEESNKVFNARLGKNIDMVLLNYGGIRSILPKGDVTIRTAYQLMPFENSVVVCELSGIEIKELIAYLQLAKRAHPISGLKISLNKDYELVSASIKGQPINDNTIYYVATNDYLYAGGDRMDFFKKSNNVHVLDYKIRNVLIDYFRENDTLSPVEDDRFIKIN